MTDFPELSELVRARRWLPPPKACKSIREAAGLSQGEVANALGVHRLTVSRWERGTRHPRADQLVRYTDLLRALQREVAA